MIEHPVTFSLKHRVDTPQERSFLQAAGKLGEIPNVIDFVIRRQTSPKNPHHFGISMKFQSAEDYAAYSKDPIHADFVKERWLVDVKAFLEADFEALGQEQG